MQRYINQHQLNDNYDKGLKMSELHSNTSKYAPLSLKGDDRPIKYMTNVVTHMSVRLNMKLWCINSKN